MPVPVASRAVRDGGWVRVCTRSCGVTVDRVRTRSGEVFVKAGPRWSPEDLRFDACGEARRLDWLSAHGFPAPEVIEVGDSEAAQWIATAAIGGCSAAGAWSRAQRDRVVDVVADVTRALHSVPASACPFDRRLAVMLPCARRAVAEQQLDLDDLDPSHQGWTAAELLSKLEATPPPPELDVVVCHGDLCLDNVLVAPGRMSPAGLLDAGRLGLADRWVDLAIILRNLAEEVGQWGFDQSHAIRFLRRYGAEFDAARLDYYRLLDEFA